MPIPAPIPPIPTAGAPALRVTLPGGLVVEGVAQQLGADALTQARALIGAANVALAPLGPVFTIIDAILSIKDFAQAVPELVVNPGAVVEAVVKLLAKVGKLASIIPQLSVPLMILGIIDAIIAFLDGIAAELEVLAQQVERVEATRAYAASLPPDAAEALIAIADAADEQLLVQQADLATSLGSIAPLLGIVNVFCELIGLGGVSVSVDMSGGIGDAVEALDAALAVLQGFRSTIPI